MAIILIVDKSDCFSYISCASQLHEAAAARSKPIEGDFVSYKRGALVLGVVAVATLPILGSGLASADYAPQSNDIVGVGGDTPQYASDFIFNGDTNGDEGFNASTGVNRVISFDATADANGRAAYGQNSSESSPNPLNPTVVLRAGTSPVQRPQSSSAAIAALEADTGNTDPTIDFVTAASIPASNSSVPAGGLDYVKFATDSIEIAVDQAGTHAPLGLTALQLANIYNGTYRTWNQIPGNSGGSTDTIIPLIPPSTSSVYSKFVAALTSAYTSGTFSIDAAVVQTVEQNDPTAITGAGTPADAIVPFSLGRLNLWNGTEGTANAGYFSNPATVYPGGAPVSPGVQLLTGTPPNGGTSLNISISDYVIWPAADSSIATPYQPGGAYNWVQTLFYNATPDSPAPYLFSQEGQALIAAAGVTPVATPTLGTVQAPS